LLSSLDPLLLPGQAAACGIARAADQHQLAAVDSTTLPCRWDYQHLPLPLLLILLLRWQQASLLRLHTWLCQWPGLLLPQT
jgi:hypothetical protein